MIASGAQFVYVKALPAGRGDIKRLRGIALVWVSEGWSTLKKPYFWARFIGDTRSYLCEKHHFRKLTKKERGSLKGVVRLIEIIKGKFWREDRSTLGPIPHDAPF